MSPPLTNKIHREEVGERWVYHKNYVHLPITAA